ncbi:MAG: tetratricopeptide repeat protein [Mojavia pulchra JT2-VF2]|jgi:tetratricopeptide (TPR) repeat protein|uniref:Tetratricopeptide repeat protein n=1 Tax=Mojavia pulchra JT2-VF2 TaxID=287848 RepID=A0A951UEC1_9NOST|nr:tetratricopeptide repeat protein [Mojavia pulchra JT2-VF2]
MSIDKMRPSPKGNLPLQDWLVPVLYQQEPYTPFVPKKTSAAREYHHLGIVAQEQRQFDVAVDYYQKTYKVFEQFRDWRKASQTLGKWGRVLEAQENYAEALQIYISTLAIDLEHNEEWLGSDINDLARMLQQLGESQFQTIWREATGKECAGEYHKAIWAARDRLETEP